MRKRGNSNILTLGVDIIMRLKITFATFLSFCLLSLTVYTLYNIVYPPSYIYIYVTASQTFSRTIKIVQLKIILMAL